MIIFLLLTSFLIACSKTPETEENNNVENDKDLEDLRDQDSELEKDAEKDEDINERGSPEENATENEIKEEKEEAKIPTNQQSTKTIKINLFFADKAAAENDTPGKHGYVTPVQREITASESFLKSTLEELIAGPKEKEGNLSSVLSTKTKINGINIKDGIATIDFNRNVYDNIGGTLRGTITIQSLVYTATQFPTVDKVMVWVEGHPWTDEHTTWDKPIGVSDLRGEN